MQYLLYSKLLAWDSRGNSERPEKAETDSIDIAFLVGKLALEKADMEVSLNKLHWDKEGLMDNVTKIASRWVKTEAPLGGKGRATEDMWATIKVKLA